MRQSPSKATHIFTIEEPPTFMPAFTTTDHQTRLDIVTHCKASGSYRLIFVERLAAMA
jgi:hypothetical protein